MAALASRTLLRVPRAAGAAAASSPSTAFARHLSNTPSIASDKNVKPAPKLGDIVPDGAKAFDETLAKFRETHKDNYHLKPSNQSAEEEDPSRKKQTGLQNLIYGTVEGQNLDKEIEQSFSKMLARGKYVHSIVHHRVKPEHVDEYHALVGSWYPKVAQDPANSVHLVGSWRSEVGECDTFVHIWEYNGYDGYHKSLHSISKLPGFDEFNRKLRKLIYSKSSSLMQEFSFWPTTAPRKLGGIFELRSYTLHPGNLLEWETYWRQGLRARRNVMEGVGAWFVQVGELDTVHHMWQFANLEERKLRREQSWAQEGWSDTVHKTVPLIKNMRSNILLPCEWSPVA